MVLMASFPVRVDEKKAKGMRNVYHDDITHGRRGLKFIESGLMI